MQQRSDTLPRWPLAVDGRLATTGGVLAVDYDGTIAEHGRVSAVTEATLRALREANFRMILVSGRRLQNILPICNVLDLFDRLILENGAVSYCPKTGTDHLIAPAVNERFLAELERDLPGAPLFIGRSMVATSARNADSVEMLIQSGGYDLYTVGCGGRVLVLPRGVSKGSGLSHALADLGLGRDQVVAVGDEENDIDLIAGCALSAAVGNASPQLKAAADIVLPGGCEESMQHLADLLLGRIPPFIAMN
ncbi:HAD family hydrolase [Pleomorphomonas sp. JP5]|uniref:HAD family hydrolase n=1 Tax=Pleomorphomonas sp. JP5 TaxID=2942998 RepID=UPI0020435C00|nr:HAD family hydrolase [Pleomorphomonas sp. JP5]MCM5558393.1 Cof-type HAD-IIB family hydrolase [Pleomorphomonas sp. JP5]